jgi:hypothetical protein
MGHCGPALEFRFLKMIRTGRCEEVRFKDKFALEKPKLKTNFYPS